jgi:peroxiredoxin
MFGFKPYNYERFTRDVLADLTKPEKLSRLHPRPGECAPDFKLRSLDGDLIRLSDFEGEKNVVLTFGSATCPMTSGSLRGLKELHEEYEGDDVAFLFAYAREAHPGNELPAHENIEDKVAAAELLREEEEVEMPIVVDELNGAVHKKYGKLPNPTYIIDKSGRVAFRSMWSRPGEIEAALEELFSVQGERGVEHAIVRGGEDLAMPFSHAVLFSHRALERGGEQAVQDFVDVFGLSGRAMLVASRVAEPAVMNPGKVIAGALMAGGVIAGALYAGHLLRQKRLRPKSPYSVYDHERPPRFDEGDYEAVGI